MRILCNGYVDENAGSVASASHLVLAELLRRGHEVVFISKKSFVYPRELLDRFPNLSFIDTTNRRTDWLHEKVGKKLGPLGVLTGAINHAVFIGLVLRKMEAESRNGAFEVALFLGLTPPRSVRGVRTVSWAQGPPGTDIRSIFKHRRLLMRTDGVLRTLGLMIYGLFRSWFQRPALGAMDHVIVGSSWSQNAIEKRFGVRSQRVSAIPYPIDLIRFTPDERKPSEDDSLHVLWLGRIVPRKRLDLLMDGLALARERGVAVVAHVIGGYSFCPGLKSLIDRSPARESVTYLSHIDRSEVVNWLRNADVLCQPSDEENFGSSVAEAQACGTPVIVGRTNGTADYICPRSIHLTDDSPASLANAFAEMSERKRTGQLRDAVATRDHATKQYAVEVIVDELQRLCENAASTESAASPVSKPRVVEAI